MPQKNTKINYCILSNDVETHSIRFNTLRDKTGIKVYEDAIPEILSLYKEYSIKATFFYTGYIANLIPDIVKMVAKEGHEIACHGWVHDVDKAFDVLTFQEQIDHLKKAKNLLEDISGNEVISFRAPALRVNKNTPEALYKAGFRIDSSISPQRLDLFLSFGSSNKIQRIFSPRKPYFTKKDNLAFRGKGPIMEMPLSGLFLPLVGSTMRVFPRFNSILQTILRWESQSRNIPIITYLHPTEFIDEDDEPLEMITKRASNKIKYYLADVLRHKLKTKNLGPKAFSFYSKQIEYFKKHNYQFVTISEYCKNKGLLK
jgi:peptidoglycan/xylan/chitin deacetylase (PgdA/CDA1 family)